MEITLQCRDAYGIPGWDGAVEIEPFRLDQIKRIAGARSTASLFRKLIKVLSGANSPVSLPAGLAVADLDLGDFMQILVALSAASRARQVKKVYECPHCKKDQPRVIDILSVFIPVAPEIIGGQKVIDFGNGTQAVCRYTRVRDYLDVKDAVESIKAKSIGDSGQLDLSKVRERYGKIFSFEDEDDLTDFCALLDDVGALALRTEIGDMSFDDKLGWIFSVQDDADRDAYKELVRTMHGLSATMQNDYVSTCTNCKQEFSAKFEATDYFFDFQWVSSKD